MDLFSTMVPYDGGYKTVSQFQNNPKSPDIPGVSQHSAMYSAWPTAYRDDLISFVAYVKARQIPILSVALPDLRSVLGRGASFFVNGAEMPETFVDDISGETISQGTIVAFKRAVLPPSSKSIQDGLSRRINLLFNEVITMCHPPLAAHPNIVKLRGIGFEAEGPESNRNVMPVLVPECAELGNLAEVLETAKREDRPLDFEQKLSICVDVAHGLEALHACDIIHGDVKPENTLVFEEEIGESHNKSTRLVCKLTDFGFSYLDATSNGFPLSQTPPWQAPECMSGKYFKIETAKRTDIYSFGLLLWRVMLDGDPFELLSRKVKGKDEKERRSYRNELVALLKNEDKLSEHACEALEVSGLFENQQLMMLHRIIQSTLAKNPSSRELDMARLIRLLSPDFWYQTRQTVAPKRIVMDPELTLLDVENHFHELRKVDSVVHDHIALSYLHYATGSPVGRRPNAGAAYELAVCHAIGFGVPFNPEECIKWLNVAAMGGSIKAQQALPTFASVFNDELKDYVVAPSAEALDRDHLTVPLPGVESLSVREKIHEYSFNVTFRGGKFYLNGKTFDGNELLLQAAETCQYDALELLISNGISGSHVSKEGITALHFISSWDISKAKLLAIKIIQAGGDINAIAGRGSSIGGTPLMWSVMQDRLDHSQIILDLGGSAMSGRNEVNALVLSAHLHSVNHLRLLLGNTRPVEVTGWLHRLLVAAASGDSRFARIIRHAKKWETAPLEVFYLLRGWNAVFHESPNIKRLTFIALLESLNYSWGPSNTDIQVAFLDAAEIAPRECTALLRECIIQDNKGLFDELMRRKVPTTATFEKLKTCLHFCAQNPNNTTTTTYYAKRLLESDGVDVDARDETGLTPFMDALLARKWDLSHLLLSKGADVLATNKQGYNILALIIQNLNLGSAKWALKYSGVGDLFRQQAFLVHPEKKISAIQEAARLTLPRAHGMKTEVSGLFLFILFNFMSRERIDYRSDGLLPNASALDIAAHYGNVHAVKALVKKDAHLASGSRVTALRLARGALEKGADADDFLLNKNLERCIYILENWEKDPKKTEEMADSWTKLKTLDESNVKSSWEVVAWEWKAEPS